MFLSGGGNGVPDDLGQGMEMTLRGPSTRICWAMAGGWDLEVEVSVGLRSSVIQYHGLEFAGPILPGIMRSLLQ